ncbi:PilZ domain-containing protein [Sedimenticola sp.]|uniref:PilZ domain-containing protein n=1 Tax=Sedimenticola sp. TaxID=1940285 RepID=UPI003D1170B9
METEQGGHNSRGVSFKGNMLLRWEQRTIDEPSHRLESVEKNERVLKALLLSQDIHHEYADEPGERAAADLARVEAKLDLLLDMLSQLLRNEQRAATEASVLLWLEGASWLTADEQLPAVGDPLWLSLFIDSRLAQPLTLPAVVTEVKQQAAQSEIVVAFEVLDEPVEELLSRLIFRHHRRMIAQQKADRRSDS